MTRERLAGEQVDRLFESPYAGHIWNRTPVRWERNQPGAIDVSLTDATEQVPIRTDPDGVIRVGGTRVTLDTVVAAFDAGATAEEIVQQYPSVTLADVYSVIAYYLRHQSNVRAYLAQRQRQSAEVREENERRFDRTGIRDRLLARRR
jgi:uncharacterized protein (DUF433 family)